jgi:two-component system KDP operon response regulator KdpE
MRVILIVEDDPSIQAVLRILAEANGMRVIAADTFDLARREAAQYRPDLAIVDLGLPDRDGIDLIRDLRSWSGLPIIVLTARTIDLQRKAALDAGADEFLTKPFSAPELLSKMHALMDARANAEGKDGI